MKDISKIKRELKEHIKNSPFEQIHKELKEAGLYTYANTENVITGQKVKVTLKSEESTSLDKEEITYNNPTPEPKNPYNYRLAS
ncbi:MAG: hypothetical protein WD512_04555 [Candidatus Paceibacterota bacterium]